MADKQQSHAATDAVKALARFLHEQDVHDLSAEQVDAELKKARLSVAPVMDRFRNALAVARGRSRLRAAAQRRRALSERFMAFASTIGQIPNPRERVRELLENTFSGTPQYSVAFRKFEEASDDDLAGLLIDLQFLDELEDHDDTGQS
jgi:hypothetical protein